jgi:hypothetical protein
MKTTLITIMLGFLMVVSCENSLDNECVEEFVSITNVSIPDDISLDEEFEIKVSYVFTNGCQSLRREKVEITDSTIFFGLFQCKRMPDWICDTAVRYDTLRKMMTLNKSGNYTITVNDSIFTRIVGS